MEIKVIIEDEQVIELFKKLLEVKGESRPAIIKPDMQELLKSMNTTYEGAIKFESPQENVSICENTPYIEESKELINFTNDDLKQAITQAKTRGVNMVQVRDLIQARGFKKVAEVVEQEDLAAIISEVKEL